MGKSTLEKPAYSVAEELVRALVYLRRHHRVPFYRSETGRRLMAYLLHVVIIRDKGPMPDMIMWMQSIIADCVVNRLSGDEYLDQLDRIDEIVLDAIAGGDGKGPKYLTGVRNHQSAFEFPPLNLEEYSRMRSLVLKVPIEIDVKAFSNGYTIVDDEDLTKIIFREFCRLMAKHFPSVMPEGRCEYLMGSTCSDTSSRGNHTVINFYLHPEEIEAAEKIKADENLMSEFWKTVMEKLLDLIAEKALKGEDEHLLVPADDEGEPVDDEG